MKVFHGIEELSRAVGSRLGHSGWQTIDQDRIDAFAAATRDHQWIHVDPERAAAGPFGGTIAHGFLTLSLVPELVEEVYRVDAVGLRINYGADRLRFPAPVPVGSSVRAGVELVSVEPCTGGHRALTRVTIERADGHKPVCVADIVTVLIPENPEDR